MVALPYIMQKSHKIKFFIGQKVFETTLTKSKIAKFDKDLFFDCFPELYFKAKKASYEIYAKGAVLISNAYESIKGPKELLFFVSGSLGAEKDWKDLGSIFGFIPKEWIIKSAHGTILYSLDLPSIYIPLEKCPQLPLETTHEQVRSGILEIQKAINEEKIAKCIFAKVKSLPFQMPFNLNTLIDHPSSGTKYYIRFSPLMAFCSLTPEWIYKRLNKKLHIDAIAGTALKKAKSDLESDKIKQEFLFVKQDILESIQEYVKHGSFHKEDDYLTHHNVIHRCNTFKGELKQNYEDSDLINKLHPTSAISGYPKIEAKKIYAHFENFQRGYYASPIGFYNQNKAYLAVAIRSMLLTEHKAYLFAGAGITKESHVEHEALELDQKLNLMKSLLIN